MGGVINIGSAEMGQVKEAEQFGYNGPDIVAGSYRAKTGDVWLHGTTASGVPRITVPVIIDEPEGTSKAKFNGYTVWHGMNLNEQGTPFNNAFLKSCGIDPKKFFGGKAQTEDGNKPGVVKIMKMKGTNGDLIALGGHMLAITIREKDGYWNISSHGAYVGSDLQERRDERAMDAEADEWDSGATAAPAAVAEDEDAF
ncbi:MAG: hypothetical protein ACM3UO_00410 [Bacillota bacterium]